MWGGQIGEVKEKLYGNLGQSIKGTAITTAW